MPDDEETLSVEEAGEILGLSAETVRRRFDLGYLTGYRTGGDRGWRRISRSSVEAYRRKMRGEDESAAE